MKQPSAFKKAILLCVLGCFLGTDAEDTLVNRDFSQDSLNVTPSDWTFRERNPGFGQAWTVEDTPENRCVHIISKGGQGWSFFNAKRLTVVPGSALRISCRVKINGARPAMLQIHFVGFNKGQKLSAPFNIMRIADSPGAWREYDKTILVPAEIDSMELHFIGSGISDFMIDDILLKRTAVPPPAHEKKIGSYRPIAGFAQKRIVEKMGWGLTAYAVSEGVYLSWRLLNDAPADIAFDLYRDGKKINDAPIRQTTDFLDTTPGKIYEISPIGWDEVPAEKCNVLPLESGALSPCRVYHLADPNARADRVGIGDLNGDGVYDYVVRHMTSGVDPWYTAWFRSPGTCKLEAIDGLTGKILWTRDLGWSIEQGVWYSPFLVYDLDGDGRAEVALKTGEGDPRDADGKVTAGPEYLSILEGCSGKEISRTSWPSREGFRDLDIAYNYFSRNQLAVAYLDGRTPCLIVLRGTYSLMLVEAYQLRKGTIENLWKYSSADYGKEYAGQGAHSTRCVDIDGDGRDEIILGNAALDDDGQPLWSNGKGHPDFIYVGDLIPERPGLECATALEINHQSGGLTVSDAQTGACIWELKKPTFHVHFGFCGDIDPRYRGTMIGGTDIGGNRPEFPTNSWIFTADGKMLVSGVDSQFHRQSPVFIYWDGDLRRELHGRRIRKYDGGEVGGGTDGRFLTTADVTGDWREEVLTSTKGQLRIYSTAIPAMDRRITLMQDPFYRMAVATSSQGYHYDPMPKILPSSLSPDLVLTLLPTKPPMLRVTVSAPMHAGVFGHLHLILPDGVVSDVDSWEVNLSPGGILTKEVALHDVKLFTLGIVHAQLRCDGVPTLQGRTLLGKQMEPEFQIKVEGFFSEAESPVAETGGKIIVRNDCAGTSAKSFSAWDQPGHELTWYIDLPKPGCYRLAIRYATLRNNVKRRVWLNGEDLGVFPFLSTGGAGKSPFDWEILNLERSGKELTFDLKAGKQVITMRCESGPVNLDYIALVPAIQK